MKSIAQRFGDAISTDRQNRGFRQQGIGNLVRPGSFLSGPIPRAENSHIVPVPLLQVSDCSRGHIYRDLGPIEGTAKPPTARLGRR